MICSAGTVLSPLYLVNLRLSVQFEVMPLTEILWQSCSSWKCWRSSTKHKWMICIAVWVKPSVNKIREMVMINCRRKRTAIRSVYPGTRYWCGGRVQVAGHPHWQPAEMEDLHRGNIQEGDEQARFPKTAEILQCVEQNPGDFLLPQLCCDVLWDQQSG